MQRSQPSVDQDKSSSVSKTQKDFFNIKTIKYKRIANTKNTLFALNMDLSSCENQKSSKNTPTSRLVEFPVIEYGREREESKNKKCSSVLIMEKRIVQEELTRRTHIRNMYNNSTHIGKHQKQFFGNADQKSIQAHKKATDLCMNMLGLDVIKISAISQQLQNEKKAQQKFSKMSKISQKMGGLRLQNEISERKASSKRSETIETLDETSKMQHTDIVFKAKKLSSNSIFSHKTRRMSQNSNHSKFSNTSSPGASVVCFNQGFENSSSPISPSPTQRKVVKKQYLYKRLQGTEHNKKQEFGLVYDRRIKSYVSFLLKLQISHNFWINLDLGLDNATIRPGKYKAYVGPGNNGAMIKGILKRRFWWTISSDRSECQFVWTQIKINEIFQAQKKCVRKIPIYDNFDEDPPLPKQKKKSANTNLKSVRNNLDRKQAQFFAKNELSNDKILHEGDLKCYENLNQIISGKQKQPSFAQRCKILKKQLEMIDPISDTKQILIHNHFQNNFYLGNKKALFYNLREYYSLTKENVFDYIPLTFHIKKGMKDPEYERFCQYHKRRQKIIKKQEKEEEQGGYTKKRKTRNIWIVKPGQNTNQGRGITVIDEIYELNMIIKQSYKSKKQREREAKNKSPHKNSSQKQSQSTTNSSNFQEFENNPVAEEKRTFIVQMYLDRPFLYNNRKFDIRHYMMISNFHGVTRAYWYEEGYIRTSSYEFNIDNFEPEIHLTNDSIQKEYLDYGKYEPFNKLSYEEFQRYLDLSFSGKKYNFKAQILPQMKKMARDAAKSVYTKLSPGNPMNNFEIFGLDFMIDKNFEPWLIEINTNPCLDCSCPLLDRIIPYMVQQSFKLSLDVLCPPPSHYPSNYRHNAPLVNLQTFKYSLIFDSQTSEGSDLVNLYKKVATSKNRISNFLLMCFIVDDIGEIQDDETFEDEGKEAKLQDFT